MRPSGAQAPSFAALRHRFGILCADVVLAARLHALFEPFVTREEPRSWYEIAPEPGDRWRLQHDDEVVVTGLDDEEVASWILWHVNQTAVATDGGNHVLLHASVTSWDGVAVVMPADSGAGKSSLAAATLQRGARYLSDELAVIDRASLRLTAYPKPLSLGSTAAAVLGTPGFSTHAATAPVHADGRRHLPVREEARADEAITGVIVVPRYVPGEPPALRQLTVTDALLHLIGCTFEFEDDLDGNLSVLSRLAGTVPAYVVTTGELLRAAELVRTAVHELAPHAATGGTSVHA